MTWIRNIAILIATSTICASTYKLVAQCTDPPTEQEFGNASPGLAKTNITKICSNAGPFALRYCSLLDQALLNPNPSERSDAQQWLLKPLSYGNEDLFVCAMQRKLINDQLTTDLDSKAKELIAQAVSTLASTTENGANGQSSGSTNLVTKPTATDFISVAAESGAFSETSNASSVTLTANAGGIQRYLDGKAIFSQEAHDILKHIGIKATLNVSQSRNTSSASSVPANGGTPVSITSILLPQDSNLTFNALTVNFSIWRRWDPRNKDSQKSWSAAINESNTFKPALKTMGSDLFLLEKLAPQMYGNLNADSQSPKLSFADKAADAVTEQDFKDLADRFESFAEALQVKALAIDSDFESNAYKGLQDELNVYGILGTILDKARGTPLLTAQYTYSVPPSKPATNDATITFAYVGKSKSKTQQGLQFNANAYASWYASQPKGATYQQLRACQFSGELDKPLGANAKTSPSATASLAAYGQYQYDKTVLNITSGNLVPGTDITLPGNAQVLLGTKGWTGIAQAKVVFNIPKAKGMSIPVAAKWSNQTDLRTGGDWRGQFGISYDLSALSSLIAPAK